MFTGAGEVEDCRYKLVSGEKPVIAMFAIAVVSIIIEFIATGGIL